MKLYRTAKGEWHGTQADAASANKAEGSDPGTWKTIEVPTKKASLLDFLNNGPLSANTDAEGPEVPATRPPPPIKGSARFRVYFKGLFAGVVLASSQADAEEDAPGLLTVKRDLGR